jgi:integrase
LLSISLNKTFNKDKILFRFSLVFLSCMQFFYHFRENFFYSNYMREHFFIGGQIFMAAHNKTNFEGVFYRERKKKFQGLPDKVYEFCYQHLGKKHWVTFGRTSEGATAQEAYKCRLLYLNEMNNKSAEPKPEAKPFLVKDATDLFMSHKTHNSSPESVKSSKSYVKKYYEPIGHLKISELTVLWVEDFVKFLSQTLVPSTVAVVSSILRKGINLGIKKGLYRGINPMSAEAGFPAIKGRRQCERYLTLEEAETLLDELKKSAPIWHDMAFLSLNTGIRCSELYKITPSDLNPEALTLNIPNKSGKVETLSLTKKSLEVLMQRALTLGPHDNIFPRQPTYAFRIAVERLGLNKGITDKTHRVWFHTLRHTFASWLVLSGEDIYSVQKLMRFNSLEQTLRYSDITCDEPHK